jgi:two-component system sensor histidine kinase MtrB
VLSVLRRVAAVFLGSTRTLRSRIVLALTVGGLAVCAVFALATYSVSREYLLNFRQHSVLRQAYVDANFLRAQLATAGVTPAQALAALSPAGSTSVLVRHQGTWSSSVLDVGPDAVPPSLLAAADRGTVGYVPTRTGEGPALAVAVPLIGDGVTVYEIAPLVELQTTLTLLMTILSIGTFVGTALAAVVGLWARQRVLRPLDPVASTAAAIAAGDLERRLPGTADPDLVTIVGAFNSMVEVLQQRIERDARFAADVSHELRSPLTTLVGSVDLLNARAAALPERSRQLLCLVTEELGRFQRLLEDLLELARYDAVGPTVRREPVDLAELVVDVLVRSGHPPDLLEVAGADATVVSANRMMLERAVANLLDNADRHAGGPTRVGISCREDALWITVDDAGPGILPEDRERVFERFATGRGPRRSRSGVGLGLALVDETARGHGGAAWCVDSPEGGARMILRLPLETS